MKPSATTAGLAILAVFVCTVANCHVSAEIGSDLPKRAPQMRNSIVRLGKRDGGLAVDADASSEQQAADQDMLLAEIKRSRNLWNRSDRPSMAWGDGTAPIWKNVPLKRLLRASYQQPLALKAYEDTNLNRVHSWLEHLANYRHTSDNEASGSPDRD
uniref:RxLR effector protein n=1 Tax=Plectus sambesii TaxID=2011161 RepID=A0A914XD42_9BILA